MAHDHVSLPTLCLACGAAGSLCHSASLGAGRLRVATSFRCGHCGRATEADGDELDDAQRAAFYAQSGRWRLCVRSLGPSRPHALRQIRETLRLNLTALAELVRALPGPVAEGTRVEMELLRQALEPVGVVAALRRADGACSAAFVAPDRRRANAPISPANRFRPA